MEETKEEVKEEVLLFDTPDIGLAGYYHAKGVELKELQKVLMKDKRGNVFGSRYAFIFINDLVEKEGESEKVNVCQELELEYGNGGLIEAMKYQDSVRYLKLMIKSKRYNMTTEEKELLKIKD